MKRLLWLCSLGMLVVAGLSTAHAGDPLPTLEELRTEYTRTLNTISTLQYRAVIQCDPNEGQPQSKGMIREFRTEVKKSGIRKSIQTHTRSPSGGQGSLETMVFDGQQYSRFYQSFNPATDPTMSPPTAMITHEPSPGWRSLLSVEKLQGHQLWAGDQGLQHLLSKPDVEIAGWEEVSGTPCIRVTFPEYAPLAGGPDHKIRVVAWFDPTHSYLPRRIQLDQVSNGPDSRADTRELEVQRFEQVNNVVKPGTRLWFPVEGSYRNRSTTFRIKAEDIVLNFELAESQFKPNYPDGTIIRDRTLPDERISFVGDTEPEFLKKIRPPVRSK